MTATRPMSAQRVVLLLGIGTAISLLGDSTLYTVLPRLDIASEAGVTPAMVGILLGANRAILGWCRSSVGRCSADLGIIDHMVSAADEFLLPVARERQAGVIAMKALGHGNLPRRDLALRFSLGLLGVTVAVIGMKEESHIDEIVANAAAFRPLSESERDELIAVARPLVEKDAEESQKGESKLFWLYDTVVTGWKHQDEPELVRYWSFNPSLFPFPGPLWYL